jgi:hypothetical protein
VSNCLLRAVFDFQLNEAFVDILWASLSNFAPNWSPYKIAPPT